MAKSTALYRVTPVSYTHLNREAEVLAVTASEGALTPAQAAAQTAALLRAFHHEGIPVGEGRAVGAPAPVWRDRSARIVWGDSTALPGRFPAACGLLAETFDNAVSYTHLLRLYARCHTRAGRHAPPLSQSPLHFGH